jgi:NAD(P)-dependent dehydrogenase (short-subunit alcohol dehydrogenase family)
VHDLLAQNAYVSILDRSPPPDDIISSKRVKFFKTDITVLAEVASAVNNTVEWASSTSAPLGGVVNCAGVGTAAKIIDKHGKPHRLDIWEFTIAVNITGSFNLTRLVLEHLVKVEPEAGRDGERGVVIFVSSAAAVSFFNQVFTIERLMTSHYLV